MSSFYNTLQIGRMARHRGNGKINETPSIDETEYEDQPRQLRSTNTMDKIFKDFVKVFVAENEKTRKLIREENEETRKLLNELILTIRDTSEQSIASQLDTSTKIACKIEECSNYTLKLLKETLSCANGNNMKEEISKAKESIQAEWNKKYKLRNELFWKFHRNQRLEEIYTLELEKEKPNLPRKFLPNFNGTESTEEKEIMDKLAKEKVRTELKLQAIRYKRQQESIKQIDSDMKNIFELSFHECISKELLNEWANQCKLGELKSQQEFSKKEEWFTKNWMTEKPVNQHNSEKDANNKERFKRSTHYKTFNRRDLIRNQNNNFRHRNNRSNFNKGFQNNFDTKNHLENENPLRRLRKQPLELQGDEEHKDIPENIPEDSLVDILAAVHSRTSSTETIIVPETQQTN